MKKKTPTFKISQVENPDHWLCGNCAKDLWGGTKVWAIDVFWPNRRFCCERCSNLFKREVIRETKSVVEHWTY